VTVLSPGDEVLVALSAALGSRRADLVEEALRAARGHPDGLAVEETLLQSYLFLGYPAALNAIGVWRSLSGRPAPEPSPDPADWDRRGATVCRTVYGGQYERLRDNVRRLHPDMEQWMVTEGYGKVLGRPGLPLATRELCVAALLAALDAPRQLYSHLRGALNAGASPGQVEAALEAAGKVSEAGARFRAAETWASLLARPGGEG
jgi:4-carboxymuconolactone decarboxylase